MRIWRNFYIPFFDIPCWVCQTEGKISKRKTISLPPSKDVFTRITSKNNATRKSLMRSITTRR